MESQAHCHEGSTSFGSWLLKHLQKRVQSYAFGSESQTDDWSNTRQHLVWNITMGTPVNIPHTEENNPLIRKCYTECILCKAFQCICNQEKQLETILVAAIRFGGSYQSCKFGFVEKYISKAIMAFSQTCILYMEVLLMLKRRYVAHIYCLWL